MSDILNQSVTKDNLKLDWVKIQFRQAYKSSQHTALDCLCAISLHQSLQNVFITANTIPE